jgi:DNA-binding MarR family transcriptional regulator
MKTSKQLERYFKGASNHRRLDIIRLLSTKGGLTLEGVAGYLDCHMTTVSEHTRRLVQAGLVDKKNCGRSVEHTLSPYGRKFMRFLKEF